MRRLVIVVGLVALAALAAVVGVRAILGSDVVRATLERQLAERLGQPVRIRSASASIVPNLAVRLRDISIGEPASVTVAEVDVVTGWRGLLSRRVEEAEIIVSHGTVTLPLPALPQAAASPANAADAAPALVIASIRTIGIRDLTLSDGRTSMKLDADSSVAGDRLDVSHAAIAVGSTRIEATGAFTSLARREGAFTARTDSLDLGDLLAAASLAGGPPAAPPGRGAAPAPPMHLTIEVQAARGRYTSYEFSDLTATVVSTPSKTMLAPLKLRTLGGSFDGRVDVDAAGPTPALRLTGRLVGVDVAQLLAAAGSPGGMTGRLAGDVSLSGSGTDAAALTASSRGTVEAAISNGAIPGLDMVRAVVLAFGKPSGAPPEGSGSAFTRLGGTFAIGGGTVTSSNLAMASRDFDMAGRGSLQLQSGGVQAQADVVLSRELTAQAGTDLRRYAQEDGRVVVPASIGGTLTRPSVSLDVAAAARRALQNEIRRRATTFFDDLLRRKKTP